MTSTPDQDPAHWRQHVERLEGDLADAEAGLERVKASTAVALLDGGEDRSREIALHRDRIDAIKTAIAEARRREAEAQAKLTQAKRDVALAKAHTAARDRHVAAQELDAALAEAEKAYKKFLGAGERWRLHMVAAGQRPMSHQKLAAGEAIRGALTDAAFSLSGALDARPYSREMRRPLASFAGEQTPWPDGTKPTATKRKAA
jgi:multidrug efflux pump subunit AcrA (membrane-fusion protein)